MAEDLAISSAVLNHKKYKDLSPTVGQSLKFSQEMLVDRRVSPLGIHQVFFFFCCCVCVGV